MTLTDTVNKIVANRKNNLLPKYNSLFDKAKPAISFIVGLHNLMQKDEWQTLMRKHPQFASKIKENESDIEKIYNDIVVSIGTQGDDGNYKPAGIMESVLNRAIRPSVEICVGGPVSSGKSVLIKSITQAEDYLIPSHSQKCTAARCSYHNNANISAVVRFITIDKFKKIFNEYVTQLNKLITVDADKFKMLEGGDVISIQAEIDTIKQSTVLAKKNDYFGGKNIPGVSSSSFATDFYTTFSYYVDHYDQYKNYIGHDDVELNKNQIENGELVPYISYLSNHKSAKNDSYRALATEEAVIEWPLFTVADKDANITLVDTMGIGEPKFYVYEELLSVLKKRADLLIALTKADAHQADLESSKKNDKEFLNVLSSVKSAGIESWVYYLCNKVCTSTIDAYDVKGLQDFLWHYMTNCKNVLDFNRNKWRDFQFMTKDPSGTIINNHEEIYNHFVNTILGNLEADIAKVDEFLIKSAEDAVNNMVSRYNTLSGELKKIIDLIPCDTPEQEETRVIKFVEEKIENLKADLDNYQEEIAKKDSDTGNNIVNAVKPVLEKPEIFKLLRVGESNDGFASLDFLNDATFYCLDCINAHLSLEKEFSEIKTDIENSIQNYKNLEESIKSEANQKLQEGSISKYYESAKKAVEVIRYAINPGNDEDNPNEASEYLGRELNFFTNKREELYNNIWSRMDKNNKDWKKDDLDEIKKNIADKIKQNLESCLPQKYVVEQNNNSIEWLKAFASAIKSDFEKLSNVFEMFINSTISLPEIVNAQASQDARRELMNVQLNYQDEDTAAYSMWRNLFQIDFSLRDTFLEKYKSTFKHYRIYTTKIARPLFDKAFDIYGHKRGTTQSAAYNELRSVITIAAREQRSGNDEQKCKDAAAKFRELFKFIP